MGTTTVDWAHCAHCALLPQVHTDTDNIWPVAYMYTPRHNHIYVLSRRICGAVVHVCCRLPILITVLLYILTTTIVPTARPSPYTPALSHCLIVLI